MKQLSLPLRQSSWSSLINSYESPQNTGYSRSCWVFVEKVEPSKSWTSQKTELHEIMLVLTINALQILKRIVYKNMETTEYQLLKSLHLGKYMRRTLEPLFFLAHIQCSTHCHPSVTSIQFCLHWITSQSQQLAFQMVNFPNGKEALKFSMGRRQNTNKSFLFLYL